MYTTRVGQKASLQPRSAYSENYFTSRKKILNDYLQDEESENIKYIQETENLVSQTKMFLKDLIGNQVDFDTLNEQLKDIELELQNDCNVMKGDLETLKAMEKSVEKQILEAQKEEENETKEYMRKIDALKLELESKEFTIQNMERLYIELENVIKGNIQNGNEELLTMEQFNDFLSQNLHLKEEIKSLEKKKEKLDDEYNKLLKANLDLRKNDENFEIEKIKEILDEFEFVEKNNKEKNNAKIKLNKLRNQYKEINAECQELTNKIKKLITNLKGLNICNKTYNDQLNLIEKEINNIRNNKMQRSFSLDEIRNPRKNNEKKEGGLMEIEELTGRFMDKNYEGK